MRQRSIFITLFIFASILMPAAVAQASEPGENGGLAAEYTHSLFFPWLTRAEGQSEPQGLKDPISLSAQNYLTYQSQFKGQYSFEVYAWAADPSLEQNPDNYNRELARLASVTDSGISKGIIFTSWRTMQAKLSQPGHADYLKTLGVTSFTYNTEGELTPEDEMTGLRSADPEVNSVAIFSRIAAAYGFKTIWGPIRSTADNVPNEALQVMLDAGLHGLGMQEQKFIETSCAADRTAAVRNTVTRYRGLANGRVFTFGVQVMPTRCLNGDSYAQANCPAENINYEYRHCKEFVDGIRDIIDSVAIWATGNPADAASDVGRLVQFFTVIK